MCIFQTNSEKVRKPVITEGRVFAPVIELGGTADIPAAVPTVRQHCQSSGSNIF